MFAHRVDRAAEGSSQGSPGEDQFPPPRDRSEGDRVGGRMSEGGGHAVGLEGAYEAFRRLWGLNLENGLGSQGLGSLMLMCVTRAWGCVRWEFSLGVP